jgi:mono/diheme cytochrome c family protein
LNDRLVHFSFGRPGLFQVLIDSTVNAMQGAVAPIHANYPVPVLKGSINPGDGQLYMAGFNLFGSSSKGISAVQRLRYTGKPSYMPTRLRAGSQGLVISFDCELNRKAAEHVAGFRVKRWNYERTHEYGSGHFKSDGTPGEEILPVLASYLSVDKKSVLLLIPGMIETDQMELTYQLQTRDGKRLDDGIWFSINHVQDLNLNYPAFRNVDLNKLKLSKDQLSSLLKSDPPITRDRGRVLFNTMGCVGCHSPGTETAGMYGPPLKGLYGSERMLADGSTVTADDNYLKESILDPGKKIAKDYEAEMPSFRGVLSDADIESVLLYIMYLKY